MEKTDNWRKKNKWMSLTFYTSNDVSLSGVEKKKLLERNNKDISLKICWNSHLWEMAV